MSQQFFDARDLWRTQVPYYEADRIEGATRTLIHVAVDAEVDRVNRTAPAGEHRRLNGVELAARGLDGFTTRRPSIREKSKAARLREKA